MTNQPAGAKARPPTASTDAYRDAATQLQLDMAIPYSGKPDKDFAALSAAYQKGAAAAARIELQHGTDPEMRRLAQQVIASAEKELALLQAWQAKHP